jgi:hypothetical protein
MRLNTATSSTLTLALALAVAGVTGCGVPGDDSRVEEHESALLSFTPLTLQNGWTNTPYATGTPASAVSSGIVYLRGAIYAGSSAVAFQLPAGQRPGATVYLPVNTCNATKGRLTIATDGTTSVSAENNAFGNAQCFTSLDGVSFAVSTTGYSAITLQNGWTAYGTRNPAATIIGNVVHLAGSIKTAGTNHVAFTLPLGFGPSTNVYLPIDLCNATKGRILIDIGGMATIFAENDTTAFGNAQCFTSLEGVSYPLSPESMSGFTCLDLQNGWIGMPYSTRMPCVKNDGGIVRLLGAVSSGTSVPFTLPAGMRPSSSVYVSADLCNAAQGRVLIDPTGAVTVQAENGFGNAQCFTSVEGVTFAP